MTNVGETSVPTTTGPLAAHLEHSNLVLEHLVTHGPATRSELATATGLGRGAIAGPHRAPHRCRRARAGRARPHRRRAGDAALALGRRPRARHHAAAPDEAVATVASLSGEELARFTVPLDEGSDDERPAPPRRRALDALAVALDRALARAERSEHPIADVTVLVDGAVAGAPPVVITDAASAPSRSTCSASCAPACPPSPRSRRGCCCRSRSSPRRSQRRRPSTPSSRRRTTCSSSTATPASPRPRSRAAGRSSAPTASPSTFAHLPVVQDGVRCECGQRGCLATVAAPDARARTRRARRVRGDARARRRPRGARRPRRRLR